LLSVSTRSFYSWQHQQASHNVSRLQTASAGFKMVSAGFKRHQQVSHGVSWLHTASGRKINHFNNYWSAIVQQISFYVVVRNRGRRVMSWVKSCQNTVIYCCSQFGSDGWPRIFFSVLFLHREKKGAKIAERRGMRLLLSPVESVIQ
jgi:hypothetical protein